MTINTAKGSWVRWTGVDDDGKFSHVGQVLADSKTGLFMLTDVGEMYVPKDDGEITEARKPKGWEGKVVTVATAPKAERPKANKLKEKRVANAKKREATSTKGKKPTKIGVAVELLSNVDRGAVTRKEMIEMVQKALGLEDKRSFAANITRDALKRIG
jgi:hypothetical protein